MGKMFCHKAIGGDKESMLTGALRAGKQTENTRKRDNPAARPVSKETVVRGDSKPIESLQDQRECVPYAMLSRCWQGIPGEAETLPKKQIADTPYLPIVSNQTTTTRFDSRIVLFRNTPLPVGGWECPAMNKPGSDECRKNEMHYHKRAWLHINGGRGYW